MSPGPARTPTDERHERHAAQTFDVHGASTGEVNNHSCPPGSDNQPCSDIQSASPSPRTSAVPQDGHALASSIYARSSTLRVVNRPDDLRIRPRPTHDHRVTLPNILAAYLIPRCCSVAYVMVTPPTETGSSTANGVTLPVRPSARRSSSPLPSVPRGTCARRPSRRVRRGAELAVRSVWSTLITAPSISQSTGVPVVLPTREEGPRRRRSTRHLRSSGGTGNPAVPAHAKNPRCELN